MESSAELHRVHLQMISSLGEAQSKTTQAIVLLLEQIKDLQSRVEELEARKPRRRWNIFRSTENDSK